MNKLHTALFIAMMTFPSLCFGQKNEGVRILLQTTYGDIHIRLYDDTPGHRDNFIKNVKDGMYDGVKFHRVINRFMVQTGNPDTRPGVTEKVEPEDTTQMGPSIPAEIKYPEHYHLRGVVAAARESDEENPDKRSSQYQFYIVTGKNMPEDKMDAIDRDKTAEKAELLYIQKMKEQEDKINQLRAERKMAALSNFLDKLHEEAEAEVIEKDGLFFPEGVLRAYRYHGGAPWLDGDYTVFGEVTDGMKVVSKIEKAKTDANDEPLEDIRILKAVIE